MAQYNFGLIPMYRFALLLLASAVVAGCPPPSSAFNPDGPPAAPRQDELYFSVLEDGSGAVAHTYYFQYAADLADRNTQLPAGDEIQCNGVSLAYNGGSYRADVTVANEYTFVYSRSNGEVYRGSVESPIPARITSPQRGDTIARHEGFTVRWDRYDESPETIYALQVDPGYSCTTFGGFWFNLQNDRFFIAPGNLQGCGDAITRGLLFLDTIRAGTMRPALPGALRAIVRDTAVFTLNP